MRRFTNIFALALCVLGCNGANATGAPVELLTGGGNGCWLGPPPTAQGILQPDPQSGTVIKGDGGNTVPVMWPTGFTGLRLPSGDVEVLDEKGAVIATTGKTYVLSERPAVGFETNGAFPVCGTVSEVQQEAP